MKIKIAIGFIFFVVILLMYTFIQDSRLPKTGFENKTILVNGKQVDVIFMQKSEIYPAYGLAYTNKVLVRKDLSPRVKRFVLSHELYHVSDNSNFGGWIGREFRANFFPAFTDPLGFAATAISSLSPERLSFYLNRFKKGS